MGFDTRQHNKFLSVLVSDAGQHHTHTDVGVFRLDHTTVIVHPAYHYFPIAEINLNVPAGQGESASFPDYYVVLSHKGTSSSTLLLGSRG